MRNYKDTAQAKVIMCFDGTVQKVYRGPGAQHRYENEVHVLEYLEEHHCPFVPRILERDAAHRTVRMTNCGLPVERLTPARLHDLFDELESFGVRHNDPFARNVTYEPRSGRFCVIDFEFATVLADGTGYTLADLEKENHEWIGLSRVERERALALT